MEWVWFRIKNNSKLIIYFIITFYLGAFASVALNFVTGFSEDIALSLDIGSFASVIVSTLLAIFVTTQLARIHEENRYIKDLAIKRIQSIDELVVEKIKVLIENPRVDIVIGIAANLRSRINGELELLKQKDLLGEDLSTQKLRSGFMELQNMFSGDDPRAKFDPATQSFIIDIQTKEELFKIISEIHGLIFETQIAINSMNS